MHSGRRLTVEYEAPDDTPLARDVVREAARWLALLHSGSATARDLDACAKWRAADREHERAWQRAEAFGRKLGGLPPELAVAALGRPRASRRAVAKAMAVAAVTLPVGYAVYRSTTPLDGLTTATGERRELRLTDGSSVWLNSGSEIHVRFDAERRLIALDAGEILVTTAPDAAPPGSTARPFLVATPYGEVRALGTRFSVREADGACDVAVFDGAVEIRPRLAVESTRRLRAGEQTRFTAHGVAGVAAADPLDTAWSEGMLAVRGMALDDFLAQLARHRRGLVRCDPAVAGLRITGVFRLDDTDAILAALPATLPVEVVYRTRWWVTLVPRAAT